MRKYCGMGFLLAWLVFVLAPAYSQLEPGTSPALILPLPAEMLPKGQPKSASELLSALAEVLRTLKAETSNSVDSSETQARKLIEIVEKLNAEVLELQTSKADSAEVSEIFSRLSEISDLLSKKFSAIQTKNDELTASWTSLSNSFEDYKKASDKMLTQYRIDIDKARRTARIATVACGVGIGVGVGFVVAGPIGAIVGACIGAVSAAIIQ